MSRLSRQFTAPLEKDGRSAVGAALLPKSNGLTGHAQRFASSPMRMRRAPRRRT